MRARPMGGGVSKPLRRRRWVECAETAETAIGFTDPTKAAKTGGGGRGPSVSGKRM